MAVIRRSPLDPYPVTPHYLETRNSALHIPATQFPNMKIKADEVYGVVVDIPMGPALLVTMVCFINGAANLYYNQGGEYVGASTRYKSVVQAARNLVVNAGPLKSLAKRTSQYPLPIGSTHFVYLLTKRGVYKTEINPGRISAEEKEKRAVYYLYQQMMGALHVAQMRDRDGIPEAPKHE